jgi:hypothetical protein
LIGPKLHSMGTRALGEPGNLGVPLTVSICLAVHSFPPDLGGLREMRAPINTRSISAPTNLYAGEWTGTYMYGTLTKVCISSFGHL